MSVQVVDCVTVDTQASTGNQSITLDLDGQTPVLAVLTVTYATATATAADHAVMSFGCTDGTNEWAVASSSEHNQATSDTYGRIRSTQVVTLLDPTVGAAGAQTLAASISSFSADTVTVNWSIAASGYKLTCWALAGDTVECVVGDGSLDQALNADKDIAHGLSGTPSWVLAAAPGNHTNTDDSSAGLKGRISAGFACLDGASILQSCSGFYWQDRVTNNRDVVGNVHSDRIFAPPYRTGAGAEPAEAEAEVTAIDGTNVTFTKRNASTNTDFGYLIVSGNYAHVSTWTFPTGTGVKTQSVSPSVSFKVRGAILGMTRINSADLGTQDTTVRGGTMGWSFMGRDTTVASLGEHAQSNQNRRQGSGNNTDTQSFYDAKALNLPTHTGATGHIGTWDSFGTTSIAIDVTSGVSSTKSMPLLLVGYPDAVPGGIAGTGDLGTVDPVIGAAPSGVAGTGDLGGIASKLKAQVDGIAASGALGTIATALQSNLDGILAAGRQGVVDAKLLSELDGVLATGGLGAVSPTVLVDLSGIAGVGDLGSPTADTGADVVTVQPDGIAGSGALGQVDPTMGATPSGLAATGNLGSLGAVFGVDLSGIAALADLGSPTIAIVGIQVVPDGIAATVSLGSPTVDDGTVAVIRVYDPASKIVAAKISSGAIRVGTLAAAAIQSSRAVATARSAYLSAGRLASTRCYTSFASGYYRVGKVIAAGTAAGGSPSLPRVVASQKILHGGTRSGLVVSSRVEASVEPSAKAIG